MARKDVTLTEQEWRWAREAAFRIPSPSTDVNGLYSVALNVFLANKTGDFGEDAAAKPVTLSLQIWQCEMLSAKLADPRNQWMAGALPRVWAMRRALGDMTAPTMESVEELLGEEEDEDA